MSTIQVRVDPKTKRAARRIFGKLGLDMSTGINLFLRQVIIRRGIPFSIVTENGLAPAEEMEILKEIARAKKTGKSYTTAAELHKDILKK